jgi:type I restriction-modification system DNA methylase subunit
VATTDSGPLRRLEDHLWQAADLFRNKVSNQKDYILALLFFKRASDLYNEELEAALEELIDVSNAEELARDPAFHVLQVPDGQTWDDVRDTDEALQRQALNDALGAIGRANSKQLTGVFERTDFNNKMALPSDDLTRIIEHFHKRVTAALAAAGLGAVDVLYAVRGRISRVYLLDATVETVFVAALTTPGRNGSLVTGRPRWVWRVGRPS